MVNEVKEKKKSTREKILEAAVVLFLEKGFNGTSMSDIAKAAGVNQSLIHHHFDTKDKLWGTIRDQLYNDYLQSLQQQVNIDAENDLEYIKRMMQFRFDFIRENPQINRMMQWQGLSNDLSADSAEFSGETANQRIQSLLAIALETFERAKANQSIPGYHEPAITLITIVILTSGWFEGNNQWLLKQMLGDAYDKEALTEKYIDFIKTLITKP